MPHEKRECFGYTLVQALSANDFNYSPAYPMHSLRSRGTLGAGSYWFDLNPSVKNKLNSGHKKTRAGRVSFVIGLGWGLANNGYVFCL